MKWSFVHYKDKTLFLNQQTLLQRVAYSRIKMLASAEKAVALIMKIPSLLISEIIFLVLQIEVE